MIKTAICFCPSDKGKIDSLTSFTKEYCRLCLGVLPHGQHRITVFYGNNVIFKPKMTIDQFKTNINIQSVSKIKGMLYGTLFLLSNQPNTFNVGRLIMLCDQNGIKLPGPPTREILLQHATSTLSILLEEQKKRTTINFDRLYFELIIFLDQDEDPGIEDVKSEDELIHVKVKRGSDAESLAQKLARDHLKLSYFQMKKFHIYFLDVFKQAKVTVSKVVYQNPQDLVGPVEVSYPCVILNKDMPVFDELRSNVIVFDDQWLLSSHDGKCFLSKIGPVLDQDSIQKFAFKADLGKNLLIQKMPPKLVISPKEGNWTFKRTAPSPAINSLTRFCQLDDENFVIFSPSFTNNKNANSLIYPIFFAVGKESPDENDLAIAGKGIAELVNTLQNAPQTILHDVVKREVDVNNQEAYAKALEAKRAILIGEIYVILDLYKKASQNHSRIYQGFVVAARSANLL